MTYKTVMVNLQSETSNSDILYLTSYIAKKFQSKIVGITASQPNQVYYSTGSYIDVDIRQKDQDQTEADFKMAEGEFRRTLQDGGFRLEWRSATTRKPLSQYICAEGRSADLILTGIVPESTLGAAQKLRIGELAMEAGRPLLIVPAVAQGLQLDWVFIAWLDTCEARRAVSDALPLLQHAKVVTVCEVYVANDRAGAELRCKSVEAWLKTHGVTADALPSQSAQGDAVDLGRLAQGADLIVGGAFSHGRPHEWVFGGVTRDLLLRGEHLALVAH